MKPKETIDIGQQDLFRSRLDRIIDMKNGMVIVAGLMDWDRLAEACGGACSDKPGRPALPTRLMAGLHILKYACNFSDEGVAAMWLMCPYYQYFCGEEFFRHDLPLDRSSMTRWRQRMGGERLQLLVRESLNVAGRTDAADGSDFTGSVVDSTVQPKNVACPRDGRLIHKARDRLVKQARAADIGLRQSCKRLGAQAYRECTLVRRNKRKGEPMQRLRTCLGRTIRDIQRRIEGDHAPESAFEESLWEAERVRTQRPRDGAGRHVHALGRKEVECLGRGNGRVPWQFGVKASMSTAVRRSRGGLFVTHVKTLPGRPHDSKTLPEVLPEIEDNTGVDLELMLVDRGCRGFDVAEKYKSIIFVAGPRRDVAPAVQQQMSRRNAVEPVIGHVKNKHRMDRNYLAHAQGDAVNAVLAAVGYNFSLLFKWAGSNALVLTETVDGHCTARCPS